MSNQESSLSHSPSVDISKTKPLSHHTQSNNLQFTFQGTYFNKCKEGFGIITWSNKSTYKGNFIKNLANGYGIYTDPAIGRYEGEYFNDKQQGYGIYIHITNNTYEGEWSDEKQEGVGVEQWKDGSLYEGEFYEGKKHGMGKYIFPNKDIYCGEWKVNLMSGYGIYYFKCGNIYIGEWLNSVKHGYGELYCANGNCFFGFFENNLPHGVFIYYNNDTEKIMVGFKVNGKLNGLCRTFVNRNDNVGRIAVFVNNKKEKEIKIEKVFQENCEEYFSNYVSETQKDYIWNLKKERKYFENIVNGRIKEKHEMTVI